MFVEKPGYLSVI